MMVSRAAWLAAILVLGLAVGVPALAVAQAPPAAPAEPTATSLRFDMGDLFPAGSALARAAPTAARCGQPLTAGAAQASQTFTVADMGFDMNGTLNGTAPMYHFFTSIPISLTFVSSQDGAPLATSGFRIDATLQTDAESRKATHVVPGPLQSAQPVTRTFSIVFNETSTVSSHNGAPFKLLVVLVPEPPQAGAPSPVQSVQLQCGPATKMGPVTLYRGMPGDQDLDGDGIPDPQDNDRDGDTYSNAAETAGAVAPNSYTCTLPDGTTTRFADNSRLWPGGDADGDGVPDEEECGKSSDPFSAASKPAVPRTIWDVLIPIFMILIILGLLAAIVFLYLKFGKIVNVAIVSTPELFVPAGSKGKYEVAVEHLAKKGQPRTFQMVASGMPEGWDAKLSADHVTLELAGTDKARTTVWLEVESPEHTDPESAVVTVKAVPLNAAGRKESLKIPGKVETITSINVPPGSKVPVKRGGKVEAAEPDDEPATGPAAGRPIIDIEGVGGTYDAKLKKMGIATIGELRAADPVLVAKKTGAPEASVRQWQSMGELMEVPGVGPQYSELLVRSGVTSIAQLAEAKPKELAASIEKLNAERQVPIQGGPAGEKSVKNWVKAAGKWIKKNAAPSAEAPAAAPAIATPPAETKAAAKAAAAPAPAPAAKPQLQVGGLKHSPASFHQGEAVKSSVSVQNNGSGASTIKLSLFVNDGLADVQTITVKAGKSKDVQFKWTAQEKNKLNIRGEIVPG